MVVAQQVLSDLFEPFCTASDEDHSGVKRRTLSLRTIFSEAEADLWFLVPLWVRFPDCAPTCFSCRFALFLLFLPSLMPPPLVPWAAAPFAYPSIHHSLEAKVFQLDAHYDILLFC